MILKRKRLRASLTLQEVAEQFNCSKQYISSLENGKKLISDSVFERFNTFYDRYGVSKYLEAKFDWVRIRIPTHNIIKVIKEILGMDETNFYTQPTGLYGYVVMYQYDMIRILVSNKGDERGILIELSGQGCRNYDYVLEERNDNWRGFFERCFLFNAVVKRVDVAIDDFIEIVPLPQLARKVKKGEYESDFKKCRVIDSHDLTKDERDGVTIYLGSRQSLIHFCFYQKNFEIAKRERIPLEDIEIKNRYEVRFMSKKAQLFINEYMLDNDFSRLILNVIGNQITFLEKLKNCEYVEWRAWRKFIGELDYVNLRVEPIKPNFQGKVRWIRQQVARTLKIIQNVDEERGSSILQNLIDEAELDEKDMKVIDWELLEGKGLLKQVNNAVINIETGEIQ